MSEESRPVLAIICGGAPVPGLNGVIASAVLHAKRLNWTVIGINDGYTHLATGDLNIVAANSIELNEANTRHISSDGGSILKCDRFDPTQSTEMVENVHKILEILKVKYFLVIGGTDKIRSAHYISQGIDPFEMKIIVVPKTIDNDIPIPAGMSTFGYHSARSFGTKLIKNLIQDAHAVPRWHIVIIMGRQSGHLGLSIAEASGAQLAIIPEDFGSKRVSLDDICDIFEGTIYKRLTKNKNYGVLIVSESIINQMNASSLQCLFADGYVSYGSDGQIVLDDADLGRAIQLRMKARMLERNIMIRFNNMKLGHELRGCAPGSFDEIYSHDLGFAAIEGFRTRHSNCVVIWENGHVFYWSFRQMMDQTGRILPRRVNINGDEYRISREYMWHLKKSDFSNNEILENLANVANMTVEQFVSKYSRVPALTLR